MHNKLSKFSEFANALYPHELDYLLCIQQFEQSDNLKILNLINYNSKNPRNILPYDITVDKRRYSYMKNWIETNLEAKNVDLFYDWLIGYEKKILTDLIQADEEKELLKKAITIEPTHYYFIRFYELMRYYRDFLLIRNRTDFYHSIEEYLKINQAHYEAMIKINTKLNCASEDIVGQYFDSHMESRQWEDFLTEVFFNPNFDGYTRYRAAVRLTYMYYNYREFAKLRIIYDELDRSFQAGVFYSRRILANYYANRAMMHSKLNELADAEKYAYLSIRHENSDYIFYLLNLCGVLLKSQKNKDALAIMQQSIPMLKKTANYYYRIGFAAFYIRTLTANKLYNDSADYADTFHNSYKKEISKNRWHLFYSNYFQALSYCENYSKILSLSRRYKLIEKEKQQVGDAKYLPVLLWYNTIADYMEGNISEEQLEQTIIRSCNLLIRNNYKINKINVLLNELSQFAPGPFRNIRKKTRQALTN
ncbi:MAG: hypothetical protein K0B37_02580 [Bacteroidales bacterium]|nr:hypothetical protein [Bacteroidales bacterium]